jgi:hypothetical protein
MWAKATISTPSREELSKRIVPLGVASSVVAFNTLSLKRRKQALA